MRIPTFPKLKKLALSDKKEILLLTKPYPPYSDFNFTSLWSYNVKDDIMVSVLNNNLVVRFRDYITGEQFYSFLGINNVVGTTNQLLQISRSLGQPDPYLKLIPETNIKDKSKIGKMFHVVEDKDNSDYILSVNDYSNLEGARYYKQRKLIRRLIKRNPTCKVDTLDLLDNKIRKQMIELFYQWGKGKNKNQEEIAHELLAIERTLKAAKVLSLITIGVYIENKLVGFIMADIEHKKYVQSHFLKYIPSYNGLNHLMHHFLAKEAKKKKYEYINIAQDLGLLNLRKAKENCKPVAFLKKYIISQK